MPKASTTKTDRKTAPRKAPDTIFRRRSAALSLLQMVGRWEPFEGPTGTMLWRLPSESRANAGGKKGPPITYTVYISDEDEAVYSCTCPDATYPAPNRPTGPCKHVLAVRTYLRILRDLSARNTASARRILRMSKEQRS